MNDASDIVCIVYRSLLSVVSRVHVHNKSDRNTCLVYKVKPCLQFNARGIQVAVTHCNKLLN